MLILVHAHSSLIDVRHLLPSNFVSRTIQPFVIQTLRVKDLAGLKEIGDSQSHVAHAIYRSLLGGHINALNLYGSVNHCILGPDVAVAPHVGKLLNSFISIDDQVSFLAYSVRIRCHITRTAAVNMTAQHTRH